MKMKKKKTLKILRNDKAIFNGKFIDLPIKEAYLISKSIELFDDEDPCIIHQSYVIKELVSNLLNLFNSSGKKLINAIDYMDDFDVVDFSDISTLSFELAVK